MELVIKKCPFCNGDAHLYSVNGKHGYFAFVQCSFCSSQGKTYFIGQTREIGWEETEASMNAVKAWNTRYGE